MDQSTVDRHHLRLGQTVGVVTNHPVEYFTLVGVTRFGSVGSIGGASLVSMDLKTVQHLLGKEGKYDRIAVAAEAGVSQAHLVQNLKERIPAELRSTVTVETAEQNANDQTKSVGDALSFLTIALLAFGGIAVFVGAFIIFNTFSITVAQRAREFALLRTIGATRAQVLRSVVIDALVIGITASLVGLFAGLGIARGLNSLFLAFGIDIPNAGLVLQTRTVVVALLVGSLVTLSASLVPAIRATRVPAIAALREGAELPKSRLSRYLPAIALVLGSGGGLLLAFGIVAAKPGTDLGALKQRISHLLITTFPTAQVNSQQDIKDQASTNVNQLLAMIYLLLAMSVVVSLFGIIDTLVLSVYERTREIGMLRAIGTNRTQVRWLIRAESVITSVVGAILGLLLGVVLAILATAGLRNEGIEFALPLGQLLMWVVFAVFFGIVAAAWPARRAARLKVLEAVAYE